MTRAQERFEKKANKIAATLSEDLQSQYMDTWLTNEATFCFAYGELPVIDVDVSYIDMESISEDRFDEIKTAIEALGQETHKGFKLLAMLSDNSGYAYWVDEGDLRIMLTAQITDIKAIDGNTLLQAFVTLADKVNTIVEGDAS